MTHEQPSASNSTSSTSATPRHLDAFARRLIRRKARQLACRSDFTRSDCADIEQDLAQKLVQQMEAFDPAAAHWYAFVTTVVERQTATLVRDRRAAKRDRRRVTTLHVLIDGDDGPVEFAQTIASDEHLNRTGRWRRSDAERAELALDTATVLAALPEDLRDLAVRLMDASPSQVARDLGVPRSTLQRRMERLRRHFEDAGLRDYR